MSEEKEKPSNLEICANRYIMAVHLVEQLMGLLRPQDIEMIKQIVNQNAQSEPSVSQEGQAPVESL